MRDGKVPDIDVPSTRARAQAFFDTYVASFSDRDARSRATAALMPPSFPARAYPAVRTATKPC